jgi:aminoglycoside phosphotransferase (APT) family kinase protein
MHDGEADIDAGLVRRLVAAQFPQWAGLPVTAAPATGTVNAIYRLGDDLAVRLPRLPGWAPDLGKEQRWLPVLGPRVPLAVPEPMAAGRPGEGYPFPWAVYRWLDGEAFSLDRVADERRAAADLAAFVAALRAIDTAGAPRAKRGSRPLAALDGEARQALRALRGVIDVGAAAAAWEGSLASPPWDGRPRWSHGDLLPPNLLVAGGRLHAVIDFGSVGVGDPALDVIAAWSVFGPDGRAAYRRALAVDDATWLRARGIALHQALLIIPYYPDTNPAMVRMATRTVGQVLADVAGPAGASPRGH